MNLILGAAWGQHLNLFRGFVQILILVALTVLFGVSAARAPVSEESHGTEENRHEGPVSNSQSGGRRFDPGAVHQSHQRLTGYQSVGFGDSGAAQGHVCTPAVPFTHAPEALARYAGATWLTWSGGEAGGSILSEDDGGRHALGYRNRWRYTVTGAVSVGLPTGCQLRLVTVQASHGGAVVVTLDAVRLLILPGDPDVQNLISRVAPACESNEQLVSVEERDGRWVITIEDPNWLPWTRKRC